VGIRLPFQTEAWWKWARDCHNGIRNMTHGLDEFLFGHRIGAALEYSAYNAVTVTKGNIWFEDGMRKNVDDLTITLGTDMESGVSFADNTWYYVYAKPKTTSGEGFECFFSDTAPNIRRSGRHPTEPWVYLGPVISYDHGGPGSAFIPVFYHVGNVFKFIFNKIGIVIPGIGSWFVGAAFYGTNVLVDPGLVTVLAPPNMLAEVELIVRADMAANNSGGLSIGIYDSTNTYLLLDIGALANGGDVIGDLDVAEGMGYVPVDGSSQVYLRANELNTNTNVVSLWNAGFIDPWLK